MRNGGTHEYEMQQWFMEAFKRENLVTDDPPLVAVNANSGDPHYALHPETSKPIREGDFVLLDVWAKKNTPGAVYYDITWTGFVGTVSFRPHAGNLPDSSPGARHRSENCGRRRERGKAHRGMGS